MSISMNLNNVMAYDIVITNVYIWQVFQKHCVSFALDALGEPSFWFLEEVSFYALAY